MQCKDLTPNLLSQYLKEELSVKSARIAEDHIEVCPACAQKCNEVKAMLGQLGNESSWNQREQVNYQYQEQADGGVIARQSNQASITEDYLNNQESIGEHITKQMKKAPWWILSFVLNGILLLLTTMIIISRAPEEMPQNTIQAELPPKQEPEFDPEEKRDVVKVKKEILITNPKVTEKSEVQVPENVEVADHIEADADSDFNEMAEADVDNQLLSDQSGDMGNFSGLGAGGGSGGAFGQRGRNGRKWLLKKEGGTVKTESAMEAALLWLKRHQSVEKDKNGEKKKELGLWLQKAWLIECSNYQGVNKGGENNNTKKFPGVCQALDPDDKKNQETYTFAMTGMALLAYAGAGHSHKRSRKYRKTIKRTLNLFMKTLDETRTAGKPGTLNIAKPGEEVAFIKFLKKKTLGLSTSNGSSHTFYQHGIVNLAINEIYGVSRDSYLKKYALEMTEATLKARSAVNGGWNYYYGTQKTKTYSSSVGNADLGPSTWAVMAIKAAKGIGILEDVAKAVGTTKKQVLEDLITMLEKSMDPNSYSGFRYRINAGKGRNYFALGIADIAFLYKGEKMREKMKPYVEYLSKKLFAGNTYWGKNGKAKAYYYYFLYYDTLALFQYGGDIWEKYNKKNSEWILNNQHQGKKQCLDGSWECPTGHVQSRVWSTAVNALQLQVYYRYKRGNKKK